MRKVSHRIFNVVDLLYLASVILISQFDFLPVTAAVFLSMPYFIVVPYSIGEFFALLFKKNLVFSCGFFERCIGCWSIGTITLVLLSLLLQVIGLFNVYFYSLIALMLLIVSRVAISRCKMDIGTPRNNLKTNLNSLMPFLLVLSLGLVPAVFQSQLWPFPLKYESDGFNTVLLTKEIIQHNYIDLYSQIHPPIVPILLSIPCMLFNLEPSYYLWGLPFLIYPLFALTIYLLARKLSNNVFLSIIASMLSMCFFGGVTNVFNLFMILPRNLLSLIFLFFLYLLFSESNSDISLGVKDVFFIISLTILMYSTISFVISPSYNHLPQIFLLIVNVVPLGFIMISNKGTKTLRAVIFSTCILLSIAFIIAFLFDINFPNVFSVTFLSTFFGSFSAIGLILFLLINRDFCLNLNVLSLAVLVLAIFVYPTVALIQNMLISVVVIVDHFIIKKYAYNLVFRSAMLLMTIVISFLTLHNYRTILGETVTIYHTSVLEQTFTYPLLIMFLVGCLVTILQNNVKEQLLVFATIVTLFFYFLSASLNIGFETRLLEFLPFPVAYFSLSLLSCFQKLLDSGEKPSYRFIIRLSFFRETRINLRLQKSWIIFPISIILLLPSLIQPYSNFIQFCENNQVPPYTFSYYEYETGIWIDNNVAKNTIIVSDPFTTWIVSSLAGNRLALNYRMVYDAKGNTHSIFYDPETLSWVKDLFLTLNMSYAETLMNRIWFRYAYSLELNQQIIDARANISENVIIIFSGRTSKWLISSTFSDVPFPQDFVYMPGYEKFFLSNSYTPLYERDNQIYVFSWLKK